MERLHFREVEKATHEASAPIGQEQDRGQRPKFDGPSAKPHEGPVDSLTETRLNILHAQLEEQGESDPLSPPLKKRAIGDGLSPTSSVRTVFSSPAKTVPAPPNQASPKAEEKRERENNVVPPPSRRKPPFINSKAQGLVSSSEPGTSASALDQNLPNQEDVAQREPPGIVRQPDTRLITKEQLVAEVKGIYAGLVLVEGKCIQIDAKKVALAREGPPGAQPILNSEQWQALIALHRTLLHEHHDFFLATQHPSATPAVRRLPIKYAMPARLWRHGIHSFLELLRNQLPGSLDHMLSFIYLAYSLMTLLYETVPEFEETWIECLGDIGRYRMAVEDDDIRDREVWSQVAKQWYLKVSDRSPETGRLYHHLAILARPNPLQQLFFYYKAVSVPQPFIAARESVLTVLQPALNEKQTRRQPTAITTYIKVHAIHFTRKSQESFSAVLAELSYCLDSHIGRVTQKYLEQGYYIAILNCLVLTGLGLPGAVLAKALSNSSVSKSKDTQVTRTSASQVTSDLPRFEEAKQLFVQTVEIHLQRIGDPNILSFLHVTMIFIVHLSHEVNAMKLFEASFPWNALVFMLNTLLRFYHDYSRIESDLLPVPEKNDFRPTPEEFAMRGLFWTVRYFTPGWFRNKNIEDENQYKEDASMNTDYRPERILWLGCQLARSGKWICYENRKFLLPSHEPTTNTETCYSQEDRMLSPQRTTDAVTGSVVPFEKEPDSENESTTDSATVLGDHDMSDDHET